MSYVPSPAGFWKRYVAYFIDVMLLSVVLHVLMTPVLLFAGFDNATIEGLFGIGAGQQLVTAEQLLVNLGPFLLWLTIGSTIGYALLAGVYFIWMEASPRQATFGKQLLGLKVTDRDGERPTTGQVVGRFVAATLSWLTLNLGHALAGWTRERRALHDYLAGTRVENADPDHIAMPAWGWAIVALNVVGMLGLAVFTVGFAMLAYMHLPR